MAKRFYKETAWSKKIFAAFLLFALAFEASAAENPGLGTRVQARSLFAQALDGANDLLRSLFSRSPIRSGGLDVNAIREKNRATSAPPAPTSNSSITIRGNLTAPNVVYGVVPGAGISISGGQRPVISQTLWALSGTSIISQNPVLSLNIGSNLSVGGAISIGADLNLGSAEGARLSFLGPAREAYASTTSIILPDNLVRALSISASSTPNLFGIGTVGRGSISIGTDSQTSILNIATDGTKPAFEIRGVGAGLYLLVDELGRVGIGTSAASTSILAVQGGASITGTTTVRGNLNVSSSTYLATDGGRVGVGTQNPGELLTIQGTLGVSGRARFAISPLLTSLVGCTGESVLETNADGEITCGVDEKGSSSSSGGRGVVNSGDAGQVAFYGSGGRTVDPAGNLYFDDSAIRLGIGTSSPATTTSIAGALYLTRGLGVGIATGTPGVVQTTGVINVGGSGTSTFANGIVLTTGCVLLPDGNCAGAGSGTITSGTANRLTYYSSATVLDSASHLTVLNNTLFGVGTTVPRAILAIQGSLLVSGTTTLDSNVINIASSTATSTTIRYFASSTSTIPANVFNTWNFATSSESRSILSVGSSAGLPRIGVGTSTPYAFFSIEGLPGQAQFAIGSTTGTNFIVDSTGYVGIGTNTPKALFSLAGFGDATSTIIDLPNIYIGSSSARELTVRYQARATTTIPNTTTYAWTIATTTANSPPILAITTNAPRASTTITGSFVVDGGAFAYDANSGTTSIDLLQLGPTAFDTDAGKISWIDLPVATVSPVIDMGYSAQIDANPVLTIFGRTDGSGGVVSSSTAVGIGTTTPAFLLQVASTSPFIGITDTDAATNLKHWTISNQGGNLYFATSSDRYHGNSPNLYATSSVPIITASSSGAVGISSSSPYAWLSVQGLPGIPQFAVGSTSGTNLIVDSLGQTGLGTATPTYRLSVSGNTYLDSNTVTLASSSAASLTVSYQANATNTITTNFNAWSFATSSSVTPIVSVGSSGGLPRVGIGTSTPYAALSVHGLPGQAQFVVGSTTGTNFIVNSIGNIGVGTTTPTARFALQDRGTGGGRLFAISDSATSERFTILGSGKVGISTGTPTGAFAVGALESDAVGNAPPIIINGQSVNNADGTPDKGGNIILNTGPGDEGGASGDFIVSTDSTERLRLSSDGFLGIGTTSPAQKLSVAGNLWLGSNYIYIGSSTAAAASTTIIHRGLATTTVQANVNAWSISTSTNVGQPPIFSIDGSNGRVGIGTATPVSLLSVSGTTTIAYATSTALAQNGLLNIQGNSIGTPALVYGRRFTDDWMTTRATSSATSTFFLRHDDTRNLGLGISHGPGYGTSSLLFGVDTRGALTINHGTSSAVVVGSLALSTDPNEVFVSGRYAYVVDQGSDDLKIIDVFNPSAPVTVGSVAVSLSPADIFVSGRYAYITDTGDGIFRILDVSNPSAPAIVGSVNAGSVLTDVYVSGSYAYIVDQGNTNLVIVDISNPSAPRVISSVDVGTFPTYIFVSGRYAYVTDQIDADLKVVDISNVSAPNVIGDLALGFPASVFVSGRYAYVVDDTSEDLKVIDVSNPSTPTTVGRVSLVVNSDARSVFVAGRYAYIADEGNDDIKIVDVSLPSAPVITGRLSIGKLSTPRSLFVSGRYLYLLDQTSDDLKIIDISGAEVNALMAHSLEAGSLQVRESAQIQGDLSVTSGLTVGSRGGLFGGPVAINSPATTTLATNISLLSLTHATGTFVGTGLRMDFATSTYRVGTSLPSGTFTGNFIHFLNASTTRFIATAQGLFGISTSSPLARLSIDAASGTSTLVIGSSTESTLLVTPGGTLEVGTSSASGGVAFQHDIKVFNGSICADNNGTVKCQSSPLTAGSIYADAFPTTPADIGENYPVMDESIEDGDIVMVHSLSAEELTKKQDELKYLKEKYKDETPTSLIESSRIGVKKADLAGRDKILGVVSPRPGVLLGDITGYSTRSVYKPVALSGRIPVKVSTENGAIKSGDRITISSLAGVGMKAGNSGVNIGLALDDLDVASATTTAVVDGKEVKIGKVMVFVNLGYSRLDNGIAKLASGETNAWSVDQQSGKVNVGFYGDIDLHGNIVLGVSKILSENGKWRIDENGVVFAEEIQAKRGSFEESLEIGKKEKPTGITIYDTETKEPYCIRIVSGTVLPKPGKCGLLPEGDAGPEPPLNDPPSDEASLAVPPSDETTTDEVLPDNASGGEGGLEPPSSSAGGLEEDAGEVVLPTGDTGKGPEILP